MNGKQAKVDDVDEAAARARVERLNTAKVEWQELRAWQAAAKAASEAGETIPERPVTAALDSLYAAPGKPTAAKRARAGRVSWSKDDVLKAMLAALEVDAVDGPGDVKRAASIVCSAEMLNAQYLAACEQLGVDVGAARKARQKRAGARAAASRNGTKPVVVDDAALAEVDEAAAALVEQAKAEAKAVQVAARAARRQVPGDTKAKQVTAQPTDAQRKAGITVKLDELKLGDVVLHHGKQLVVDAITRASGKRKQHEVVAVDGIVQYVLRFDADGSVCIAKPKAARKPRQAAKATAAKSTSKRTARQPGTRSVAALLP